MPQPSWLPQVLILDYNNWNNTLKVLYEVFQQNFINNKKKFEGKEIWWDRRKLDGKYDEGFWHLITKQYPETKIEDRMADPERAKRLPWCGPTIMNSGDTTIKVWDYQEGNKKINTYLWLTEFDYVVILHKRLTRSSEVAFLVTAFYIEYNSKRHDLQKKFERRCA